MEVSSGQNRKNYNNFQDKTEHLFNTSGNLFTSIFELSIYRYLLINVNVKNSNNKDCCVHWEIISKK